MEKKPRIFQGETNVTIPRASQKKHRRSKKPKVELGKPKHGHVQKKKDKKSKRKQSVSNLIPKLGLDVFPLIFAEARAMMHRQKELNSGIDAYILHKLKTRHKAMKTRRGS